MGRIIMVASGKGGVGKTTAVANIGTALARKGKSVLLIDFDLGLRNLDVALGLETQVYYHLLDVLAERCSIDEAIVKADKLPNLHLLAAAQNVDKHDISELAMASLAEKLRDRYDFILLDCPAGLGVSLRLAVAVADEGIVISTPMVTAVRDADKLAHLMEDNGISERTILINRLRIELMDRGVMLKPGEITEVLGLPLVGVVPEDETALIYENEGRVLVGSKCPAGQAYENIADRICGESVPLMKFRKKKGLFGKRKG